jgi:glycosyltransferase involved in cell wall biosynthesis
MLVELAARLRPDHPTLGIVVCFWHFKTEDQAYLDQLQRKAASLGVKDNILFNTVEGYFVPVIEASTLFVRPTNTDGDASSIREALYLGVPAVVSDAVERPEGSVLFRSRDMRDFEAKVRAVLEESEQPTKRRRQGLHAPDQQRIEEYIQLLSTLAQRPSAGAGQ